MARPRIRRAALGALIAALLTFAAVPLATSAGAQTTDPICPAAPGNARFVRWIYLQILNRCPDVGGLAYWTAQLDGGNLGRGDMALIVDMSNENLVNNNVAPIYQQLLGRAPTQQELNDGVGDIRSHYTDTYLIARLAATDELYNMVPVGQGQTRDEAWLSFAYNGILDRNPDQAGMTHWLAVMGNPSTQATRLQVSTALEFSGENAGDWVGAVYGAAFQRAPDPNGFAYWKGFLLNQGFQAFRMWTLFLSSNEAYTIAQNQPNPPQNTSKMVQGTVHKG